MQMDVRKTTLLGFDVFPWQYKLFETLLEQCLYCQCKSLTLSNVALPTTSNCDVSVQFYWHYKSVNLTL